MLAVIKTDVVTDLSRVHVPTPEELAAMEAQKQAQAEAMQLNLSHDEVDGLTGEVTSLVTSEQHSDFSPVADHNVVAPASRNSPCPCGSGLKYKQCHGKI
jgi:preprotein translocase subunit SecA